MRIVTVVDGVDVLTGPGPNVVASRTFRSATKSFGSAPFNHRCIACGRGGSIFHHSKFDSLMAGWAHERPKGDVRVESVRHWSARRVGRIRATSRLMHCSKRRVSIHSITCRRAARTAPESPRPSALAVVKLTTRLNLVGCSTGMSAGFAPCRILSTISAARRSKSAGFGP